MRERGTVLSWMDSERHGTIQGKNGDAVSALLSNRSGRWLSSACLPREGGSRMERLEILLVIQKSWRAR